MKRGGSRPLGMLLICTAQGLSVMAGIFLRLTGNGSEVKSRYVSASARHLDCWILKKVAVQSFETMENICPTTQCGISTPPNPLLARIPLLLSLFQKSLLET